MPKIVNTPTTDRIIFLASVFLLILFTLPMIILPEESQQVLTGAKIWIEDNFGSAYQILAVSIFVFVLWVAFGKYGKIKLGTNNHQFSTYSWASMLFCAGVATGILYWGTIEWAYYLDAPPLYTTSDSNLAIEYAATYGMFHWGVTGWSFYCLPAVAISYMYYVKKVPVLRLSVACEGMFGKHINGWPGKILDTLFMVGLLGSTGTSMGLGTPMIASGVEHLSGVTNNFSTKFLVIICCAIIFSISVYLGLGKGIKRLSNINTTTAFIFLTFVLLVGPTAFIIKMSVNSMGIMAQNFLRMITWTDPLTNSRFVEDWSIFYWAWWIAVGPFMGIFITKISGGRSIRQVILGTMCFGSMGCTIFFGILGNYALDLELSNQLNVLEMVRDNQAARAISMIITTLPGGNIALIIFCIMSVIFMATSFDSTSYTLASCATEKLNTDQEPAKWQRLFWAFTLLILPLTLMYVGGLESLKIAVLVSALPLIIVYVIMGISLYKNLLKHDQ